jgi:hypothetical protein
MDRLFYAVLTHLLNAQPLSCLICFTYRLVYAVLTHLLNAQPLACCPALSSLWTGSSKLF